MPLGTTKAGIGAAGEFQSSGLPFATSSTAPAAASGALRIDFPKVSRSITITNRSADGTLLRIGFTLNGVRNSGFHYQLDGQDTVTLELRVASLWLAGDAGNVNFSLCAGLTTVDARDMPQLSGTLSDGSTGWQGVG